MQFRDPQLNTALDAAIEGNTDALFDKIRRASGLPGVHVNAGFVQAFAHETARRGKAADGLIKDCFSFHERIAPYGHVNEIFPILAVTTLGVRAAQDAKFRNQALPILQQSACDERFRVRDATAEALRLICTTVGKPFAPTLIEWLQHKDMFVGRSAAIALQHREVLSTLGHEPIGSCIQELLQRVPLVHRAGRRQTAFRRLCEETTKLLIVSISMFPSLLSVFELFIQNDDEDLRTILHKAIHQLRTSRVSDRAHQLETQLCAFDPKPRDPRHQCHQVKDSFEKTSLLDPHPEPLQCRQLKN